MRYFDVGPFAKRICGIEMSASLVLFDRVCFYAGKTDHWGIAAEVNFYDRSISFEIFNLYAGVEVWRKE
jgi:hypothetical protein